MELSRFFPHVAPGERARFRYAFVGFMCVASAGLVARAAGDSLFLSTFGPEFLPYMYIGSALLVLVVSYVYGYCVPRMAPDTLTIVTTSLLAVAALGLRVGLGSRAEGFRIAAYFFADLSVQLPMMLFWGFAALVFNPREGKRLFGMIGAGGTSACIAAGFMLKPVARQFGTENLLLLVAALLCGFALTVLVYALREGRPGLASPVASRLRAREPQGPGAAQKMGYYASLLQKAQARNLALLVGVSTCAIVLVDYQFKAAARAVYSGPDLAGFLGGFYGFANVICLVFQLFVVHRILERGGVLVALGVFPTSLFLTSAGAAFTWGFGWILATKIVDPIFNFTVNSAAMQMLYLGVKKQSRVQTRAFVEGMCKPLAMALTGALIVATAPVVDVHKLALAVVGLSVVWLLLNWRNYGAYIAGLVDSVGARRFEGSHESVVFYDKALDAHMRQSLLTAADEEIPYLVGILPEMGNIDPIEEVRTLLGRDSPQVKVAALQYIKGRASRDDLPALLALVDHNDAEVRTAAVHAVATWNEGPVLEALERHLEDPVPIVRAAAAAELMNAADLDGLLLAGIALKTLLRSEDAEARIAATDALAYVKHAKLTRLLKVLLQDPNEVVLLAALNACRAHPAPELIPALLPLLAKPRVAATAAETLVAFADKALKTLSPPLAEAALAPEAEPWIYHVPAIVARIGTAGALPLLAKALGAPDLRLRAAVVQAYADLVRRETSLRPHLATIDAAVAREIESARERLRAFRDVRGLPGSEVLCDSLHELQELHLKNVFDLLDARTPKVDMNAIYFGLTRASLEERAEALELLDNVLDAGPKADLLALFERPAGIEAAASVETGKARVEWLLTHDPPEWVAAGALFAAAASGIGSTAVLVRRFLAHPSAVARETALHALHALEGPEAVREVHDRLRADPSPAVQALLASLLPPAGYPSAAGKQL